MILFNPTSQSISTVIKNDGKSVVLVIPAKGHSKEFDPSCLHEDMLIKVNRGYLKLHNQPKSIKIEQQTPKPTSNVIEKVGINMEISEARASRRGR